MATKLTLTHQQRVELYVKIIREQLKGPLTDFTVALMRTKCPSQVELDAVNDALTQLGWPR